MVFQKTSDRSSAKYKKSFEKFCHETSFHGFREIYYSTSICLKVLWTVLILSALGIAIYQIANAVIQYNEHPTTTVIQPLDGKPQYTPVQICYMHWIYWVDWEKAFDLGFTKPSILYGLSHMTEIYSLDEFDMADAERQFTKTLRQNQFHNLTEFYFAIAKDDPPGFTYVEGLGPFQKKFHEYWSNELCYLAMPVSTAESAYMTAINRQSVAMIYNGNYTRSRKYVTLSEYSRYMVAFLDSQIKSVDLDAHILPPAVAVDGRFDDVLVSLNIYVYLIKVQISAQQWMNTAAKPCRVGSVQTTPTSDCWQMCQLRNNIRKTEGCMSFQEGVTLRNESYAKSICRNAIVFFRENDTELPNVDTNYNVGSDKKNEKNATDAEDCAKTCLPSCEEWRIDYHIDTKTFLSESLLNRNTWVKVNYPAPSSILVMTEINSQTWETLIGNIGGLMGLWLGASLISFVQMVFLCCCQNEETKVTTISVNMKKQAVTTVEKTTRPKVGFLT